MFFDVEYDNIVLFLFMFRMSLKRIAEFFII